MNSNDANTPATKSPNTICRWTAIILRTLMGLLMIMTGSNGFLHFLPEPATLPEPVAAFLSALKSAGLLPVIMGTQLLVGLLLVSGFFVPLALALIAPIIVGIVLFHAFLAPSGIGMAIFVLVAELYLAWSYRSSFRPMLRPCVKAGC